MTRALLLLAFAIVLGAGAVQSDAAEVRVIEPRAFGYFIGDVLRRDVVVRVAEGETLDAGSLPRPGPVNYWLELSNIKVSDADAGAGKDYRIALTYQTFYAPLDPRYLTIPGFRLKVAGPETSGEVSVPKLRFLTSPIRQLFTDQSQSTGTVTELQPDEAPLRIPTGRVRSALLASGLTFLAALVALAWHNAWWPFHARPSRPFTEAARYLSANASRLRGASGYRLALLKVHRAFDLAAGRRVLADDVADFLRDHPEFAAHAEEVRRLFLSSRQAFFANDVEQARAAMPLPAIASLSAALGAAERRAA